MSFSSHFTHQNSTIPEVSILVRCWTYRTLSSPGIKADATISSNFFRLPASSISLFLWYSPIQTSNLPFKSPSLVLSFFGPMSAQHPSALGPVLPAHPKWALCSLPSPLPLLFWSPILYEALIWFWTLPHHPSLITHRTCKGFYAILHIV